MVSPPSSPRMSPPPSPTIQLVLDWSIRDVRKMHSILVGLCVILGISCIVMTVGLTRSAHDMPINIHRRRFVPRELNIRPETQLSLKQSTSPAWDYDQLYKNVKHKPSCRASFLHLIITSAADHFTERDVIRQTWCSKSRLITELLPDSSHSLFQCTFLVGQTEDEKTRNSIQQEIKQFDDILLGGYLDTYRNLTFKVLTGFHWATQDCSSAYILKTDDDCFVNTNILLKVLLYQPPKRSSEPMYMGMSLDTLEHTTVIRDPDSKWYVSPEHYAPEYYPEYISGTGYLLSQSSARAVSTLSALFVPFPVEDAYIGVLAEYAGIKAQHSFRFTLIREKWSTCNFLYLILIHHISTSKQEDFQETVKNAYKICPHNDLTMKW